MDVRTTLAFTRPRELARLYRFVVVVWTVSSPTASAVSYRSVTGARSAYLRIRRR
nr:MAG TPA: hypothetical protein [Caudoviricetes sp.]